MTTIIKMPSRENLSYRIATVVRKCVCPICGVIYKKLIELVYLDSHYWVRASYPVSMCKKCKSVLPAESITRQEIKYRE